MGKYFLLLLLVLLTRPEFRDEQGVDTNPLPPWWFFKLPINWKFFDETSQVCTKIIETYFEKQLIFLWWRQQLSETKVNKQ